MDSVRVLRHVVRRCMTAYAKQHPESYSAHMGAASVIWLLAGQPGLSMEDREERLNLAHASVTVVLAGDQTDSFLVQAHDAIHELLSRFESQQAQTKAEAAILAQYEAEFAADATTGPTHEDKSEDPKE